RCACNLYRVLHLAYRAACAKLLVLQVWVMPRPRHSAGWLPVDPRKLRASNRAGAACNGAPGGFPIDPRSRKSSARRRRITAEDNDVGRHGHRWPEEEADTASETAPPCQP